MTLDGNLSTLSEKNLTAPKVQTVVERKRIRRPSREGKFRRRGES